ncbi:hypothetical protein ETR_10377 [Erwinia tracheiphila PSU-1]|nr:hypothetical protein ETR_10377 [Erwinia tracheiphila PSU-1]
MAISIDRPVQIFPAAPALDIRFVHSPPTTSSTFMPAERPVQQRHHADDPPVKGEP